MRVEVVGAGVLGLSIALRLLERGHEVHVRASATGEQTTSSVAAALWYPYLAAPEQHTRRWGAQTYAVLRELAASRPEAGVDLRWGVELVDHDVSPPGWHQEVAGFTAADVAGRRHADGRTARAGWRFLAPVADMGIYLPWLADQVRTAGGRISRVPTLTARSVAARSVGQDVSVLAAGLGSGPLAGDSTLGPVRGQVVLVDQVGLDEWVLDAAGDPARPTYVVPRRDVVVCGGTALAGRWDEHPDTATTADVLARCRALVPDLRHARVVGVRVGLRPARPAVRLERADEISGGAMPVIACYGHGGAGVTLSWGCAGEVCSLVDAVD